MTRGRSDFVGEWAVERVIKDRLQGQVAQFSGQAEFGEKGPDQLSYYENGKIHIPASPPMQAERRYLWRFVKARVVVMFGDGRPFHAFTPSGHADGTDHLCGDDLYVVRYDFTDWPVWRAVWQVTGPRKDYMSTTTYARKDAI